MSFRYYSEQLAKLDTNDRMTIQLKDDQGNTTNWLTLNLESIDDLKLFLESLENKLLDEK